MRYEISFRYRYNQDAKPLTGKSTITPMKGELELSEYQARETLEKALGKGTSLDLEIIGIDSFKKVEG